MGNVYIHNYLRFTTLTVLHIDLVVSWIPTECQLEVFPASRALLSSSKMGGTLRILELLGKNFELVAPVRGQQCHHFICNCPNNWMKHSWTSKNCQIIAWSICGPPWIFEARGPFWNVVLEDISDGLLLDIFEPLSTVRHSLIKIFLTIPTSYYTVNNYSRL